MSGGLNTFQPGEKVSFLREKGDGIVSSFKNGRYTVVDEYGFERTFLPNELVKIYGTNYGLSENDFVANEDETLSRSRHLEFKESRTGSKRPLDVWEIDLHIESLLDSHSGMSNGEILSVQLKEMKNVFNRARSKFIQRLVIIHGVGEGVLKSEVLSFLQKQEGVEFYDADFREYGKGATMIEIRYNIH